MLSRLITSLAFVLVLLEASSAGNIQQGRDAFSQSTTVQQVIQGSSSTVHGDFGPPREDLDVAEWHAQPSGILESALEALEIMQSQYYELWLGTWPTTIDWTGAVMNTHVSAMLGTLTRKREPFTSISGNSSEIIHKYFSHNIAYYFGENAFAIRYQAYDDMLWVVLGWLESVRFINDRNATDATWHGTQFIPAFAHRARVFYDIASRGWDSRLCSGGMNWNPRLTPYKNAITNQLFISASVSMYLYFPGDTNDSPFLATDMPSGDSYQDGKYNSKYLKAAIDGYAWLKNSNMTNHQGLYVDGFHVSGWNKTSDGTGKCDARNDMVYTYNQGVILSGLRGLWEATGESSYLDDGYTLIRNAIAATGWSCTGTPSSPFRESNKGWSGLGQNGILEDFCDRNGDCSQDGQTFKGIFFQHLAQFCEPLPAEAVRPGKTYGASKSLARRHSQHCRMFGQWVLHNAKAALSSRDEHGRFGMWWGHEIKNIAETVTTPANATDYRNDASVLEGEEWKGTESEAGRNAEQEVARSTLMRDEQSLIKDRTLYTASASSPGSRRDANDRGRGRTVETQGGGLAVLRAAYELLHDA